MLRSALGATLGLKIDHIDEGRPNRPGTPLAPKFITIHNTDNISPGADAEAHAKFLKKTGYYEHNGKKIYVSWHYTVDDDSCVRHLPLNEVGWHAGSKAGNATSLGIEICMNKGADQSAAFKRAKALVACLCFDLGVDPRAAIVPHYRWSEKACPGLLLDNGKPGAVWSAFVADVTKLEASLGAG